MPMPVGVQLHGPRKRAERQTSSCTECRRRKQKVCIYPVFIFSLSFYYILSIMLQYLHCLDYPTSTTKLLWLWVLSS